jgi:two-component system phosphate regulon response regulator OmpR
MTSSKILLVADDAQSRESLTDFLTKQGLILTTAETAAEALSAASRDDCAMLALLDLQPHDEGALSLCRRLRENGCTVPVIIISSRTEPIDRVLALEMGADDYVVKPFDPRELLARISVQLRRQRQYDDVTGSIRNPRTCRFGPYELHMVRHQLFKAGEQVILTRAEFSILETLARHPNQALRREHIYKIAHRQRVVTSPRSVDVMIARLRRLLEEDVRRPRYIRTVWGIGYAFFPLPEEPDLRSRAVLDGRPHACGGT